MPHGATRCVRSVMENATKLHTFNKLRSLNALQTAEAKGVR
jgi:hypothetical protein